MKSKQQLQTQLADRFDVKADRNRYLSAIIGHPDGSVYVVERPGYVWARLGGGNGQIIQVYSRGLLPAYNLPIVVYRLPHRPRDYGIVDLDIDAWPSTGTGESNDGGYDGTGYVERHGEQHYYNAGDPVLVHLRAWTPLRIYASSGFVIGVMPGLIPRSGADLEIVHQTIDLTSHVPASGALYVLITVNAAGVLTATDGTGVGGTLDLTLAEIPDTPDGHFRLGAIRLYGGQTSIQETRAVTDIVDLRWPQERLASTITLSDLPTPIDIEHGGTSAITATAAINNLLPSQSGLGGNGLLTDGTNPYWGPVGGSEGGTIVITSLPVGVIIEFGGASIPAGWLECNGAAVSRTTYADLFAAIGTTYGVGDGSTTFNLPDFRGRSGIGQGTGSGLSARALGATGGAETHTLTTAEAPAHTHTYVGLNTYGGGVVGSVIANVDSSSLVSTSSSGGGSAHNNMQPFLVTAYIIKYTDTATSSLIFDDGATPENVTLTAATGDDVYAARRDHVHAVDQSIAPTWTATHSWTNDSDTAHAMYLYRGDDPTVHGPAFAGFRAYGTLASPSDAGINAVFARLSGRGRGSGAWPSAATGRLDIAATEAQTSTAQGTDIRLYTTPNGSTTIGLAATFGQDKSLAVVGAISASNYAGTVIGGGTIATGGFTLTVPATGTAALLATANVFTTTQQITVPTASLEALIIKSSDNSITKNILEVQNSSAQKLLTINLSPTLNLLSLDAEMRVGLSASTLTSVGIGRRLNFRDMLISRNLAGVSGADTYKTILTDAGLGGYAAVSLRYGGDIIFYGAGVSTTADAIVTPTPLLTILATKAVGVNTGSPNGNLEVQGTTTAGIITISNSDTGITSGESIGQIDWRTYDPSGTGAGTVAQISAIATTDYAGSSKQTDLLFSTGNASGTVAETFRVHGLGGVTVTGKSDRAQLIVTGFTTQTGAVASISRNDGATNTVNAVLTLGANSTGTAAAGFGGAIALNLESSTTADQAAAALEWSWATATHASRKARIVGKVYDTAARTWLQVDTDGSTSDVLINSLIYGSMYGDDISQLVTIDASSTYYEVGGGLTGGNANGMTFQNSKELLVTVAGKYLVTWSMSLSAGNNDHLEGAVMINSTVVASTENAAHTPGAGDQVPVGGSGILTLAVNDLVKLCVENETDTDDITVSHATLTAVRIGE